MTGPCSVCQRADVAAIDEALSKRDGLAVERVLASAYGVPAPSLHQHAMHRHRERAALRREILDAVEPSERVTVGNVLYRLEKRLEGVTKVAIKAGLDSLVEEGLFEAWDREIAIYQRGHRSA